MVLPRLLRGNLFIAFYDPNDPHKNDQSQKVQGGDRNPNINGAELKVVV